MFIHNDATTRIPNAALVAIIVAVVGLIVVVVVVVVVVYAECINRVRHNEAM